ncbi:MAG: hypothetical protein AABX29_09025 [Nanoarchaeota archaeon]
MKDRFYMRKVDGTQVVIDLDGLRGDQTGLVGRVNQKQDNIFGRHFLVGGKFVWVSPKDPYVKLDVQTASARAKKAAFQGQEDSYRRLAI